jgi:flavin-dependent dehydrogenase
MARTADVVIVGGGIAGSALATVLARGGHEVVLLERQSVYRDKVRGEGMADPVLGGPRLTPQLGPENVPAEAFESANVERILALAAEAAA